MEIQQKEKESLTTYIHHFETEAKRCNFTNNTATIRIFVKGLENVHSLATQIYEKGPQTLADAISEVEKLQATQQLTSTLIQSSTVNVMSLEEDHCFQCQESGHMACHCPNVQCFECDEYRHIVMYCLHRIPPSGIPAHHNLNIDTLIDPPHTTIMKTGTDTVDSDHNHIIKESTAKVAITLTEAILGHNIGIIDDITGVIHDAHTQTLI